MKRLLYCSFFVTFFVSFFVIFFTLSCFNVQASYSSAYDLHNHKEYQQLKDINHDIIGWLFIPNANLDFPLFQTSDNAYYLSHDKWQRNNNHGAIFFDYRNLLFKDENTILYGHNLKNSDQMFSSLLNYEDQNFYEQHPYLIIATPKVIYYYKIFAAYTTHTNFYYLDIHFSPKQLEDYLFQIEMRNILHALPIYQQIEQILTLSTCSFRFENARFVVHAFLLHKKMVNLS